jgi:hypothetical protein
VVETEAVSRNKRLTKFILHNICSILLLGGDQGLTGQKGEQVSNELFYFSFSLFSLKGPRGLTGIQGNKGDKVNLYATNKDCNKCFHLNN